MRRLANRPIVAAICAALLACTACSSDGDSVTPPAGDPDVTPAGSSEPPPDEPAPDEPSPEGSPSNGPSPDGPSEPTGSPPGGDTAMEATEPPTTGPLELGERPARLSALLPDGELKRALTTCDVTTARPDHFSIAHRGAPLELPEHSREGYLEAVRQGAGIVECDVTFTADGEPVCRHSQCDLHTTTDILATELAARCSVPPATGAERPFAEVRCCASDLTLAEFRTLRAKRDGADPDASDVSGYLAGTPGWQSDPSRDYATLMTLAEHIALLEPLGVAMTPELKAFDPSSSAGETFTRDAQSRRLFDEFRRAGVAADRLYPQSFELDDIRRWRDAEPDYSRRAVWLDGRYRSATFDVDDPSSWQPGFESLADEGVGYLAPPIWMLLTLDDDGAIVPSDYAKAARASGLPLLTWSLERGVDAENGGGWYFQSIAAAFDDEGDQLRALDVLARDVGVEGVFSDWPATTTYYRHCRGRP